MSKDIMAQLKSGALATVNSDARKKLMDITNKMSNGGGTYRRISIKGGKFRQMVGGEQVAVSRDASMKIIVLNSSAVSRMFYEGTYDPNAKGKAPTCWTQDANSGKPDPAVPEDQKQASSCDECPQNVKGSGQGQSRACRFSQRLAVLIEGDWDNIYQLSLPAMSIFGRAEGDQMPLGAYAKLLKTNDLPIASLVTEMYFDEESEAPKLFFKPSRFLDDEEIDQVLPMVEDPETLDVIKLTVAEVDGVESEAESKAKAPTATAKRKAKAKPEPKPEPEPEVAEEEDEDDGPELPEPIKKKSAKPVEEDEGDSDLDSLLSEWDDEDDD